MRIPTSLKIGAHTVKVVVADAWKSANDSLCGEWVPSENTIYINVAMSETLKFGTLIHEAMHVMNSTIDHPLLDSISEQMTQLLLDNKLVK